MNLIKYFLKFFDEFFHRHNPFKKTNDDDKSQGPNNESFSGNGTTPIKTDNKDENHLTSSTCHPKIISKQ